MTGGNRPPRMQSPYLGRYRMLWRWLERKYPEVLEDYKQHRTHFQKEIRDLNDKRDSRPITQESV